MNHNVPRATLRAKGLHPKQGLAFFSMAILYLFYYFCKYNLGPATDDIQNEFGISSAAFGWVMTTFTLVYAGGQFINGFLGDRYGPKNILILGGLGSVIANLYFGISASLTFFVLFWAMNGYFSSCGWAPGSRILFNWFPEKRWGTYMGIYNALCYTGGAIVTIVAGFAISYLGWRGAFSIPAAFLLVMTLVFMIVGKNKPQDAGLQPEWEQPHSGDQPVRRTGAKEYWAAFSNYRMILAYVSGFGANFVRWGIITWMVKILKVHVSEGGFGIPLIIAGIIASLAHWGGAFFSIVLGVVTDRVFKGMRWQTITIGFVLAALPLFYIAQGPKTITGATLWTVWVPPEKAKTVARKPQTAPATPKTAPAATAMAATERTAATEPAKVPVPITTGILLLSLAMFLSGGLIQAVQTPLFDLPGDILGKELSGTGVGILDGWMYVGASFAGVFLGWWLDSFGLLAGVTLMAFVSVASGLVIIPIRK
ncbi:MAG: MFS transporter [Planctomycetaceae bacterium]|nr:MFS transporter [Planctomycetaceae bacterium]